MTITTLLVKTTLSAGMKDAEEGGFGYKEEIKEESEDESKKDKSKEDKLEDDE